MYKWRKTASNPTPPDFIEIVETLARLKALDIGFYRLRAESREFDRYLAWSWRELGHAEWCGEDVWLVRLGKADAVWDLEANAHFKGDHSQAVDGDGEFYFLLKHKKMFK